MRKLAMVVLLGGGCSFIATRRGFDTDPQRGDPPIDCTVHPIAPGVDTVLAALFVGLGGGIAVADSGRGCGTCEEQGFATVVVGIPLLVIGAVYAGSAVHGLHVNQECREAVRAQAAIEGGARYYCTTSPTNELGSCSETEVGCEHERGVFSLKHKMSVCAPQLDVFCFSYGSLDGAKHVACTPSDESCGALDRGIQRQPGFSSIEHCEEKLESKPRPPTEQRQEAWTLTKAAAEAALAGDCARVAELDATVRRLDAEFHDAVFAGNAAIARCLSPRPAVLRSP